LDISLKLSSLFKKFLLISQGVSGSLNLKMVNEIISQTINVFNNPYIMGLLVLALIAGAFIIFFQKREIKTLLNILEKKSFSKENLGKEEELTKEDEKQIQEARDIMGLNKKIFNFRRK